MRRKFHVCPWCGYRREDGFTSIEFRFDLNEIWLSHGTFVEHKHLGVNLPDPSQLNIGPEGGRVTLHSPGEV